MEFSAQSRRLPVSLLTFRQLRNECAVAGREKFLTVDGGRAAGRSGTSELGHDVRE